jgi:hypothetical protein
VFSVAADTVRLAFVAVSGAVSTTQSDGVLSRYVDPVVVQKLQDLAKSPTYAEILKKELGIR